ncbi:DoxX family protein [Pseudohoeflea suaedae]|uniref:DoxX family protein n=1 Tax=Pseudohoeflea suaedae TaxID=877384 RepID=A0A4R5PN76_9HYPH|nr:DoxX family protein [Pseudohoeflea suaedae]TDH38476.1 DoxX family protein [Pseudohoeflea suaedae]
MSNSLHILLGRILMSIMFIMSGWGKLMSPAGTAGYFESVGLPLPQVTVWVVIAVELLGGLAILAGFKTRYVAYLLAAFTLAAAFIGHYNPADQMQMIMFMKNLAITGGFLVLASVGAGKFSIDRR